MTQEEYYSLKDDFTVQYKCNEYSNVIERIYQLYPDLREKTLEEIRKYFTHKSGELELKLQKQLIDE